MLEIIATLYLHNNLTKSLFKQLILTAKNIFQQLTFIAFMSKISSVHQFVGSAHNFNVQKSTKKTKKKHSN